jgi:hypothetical protein
MGGRRANAVKPTAFTMRTACCTDIAAVKQQPMMCPWNIFHGYIFYQFLFYLQGIVGLGRDQP